MRLDGVRQKVFLDRYALKDKAGKPIEKTPEEMWRRVARGIASVEKKEEKKKWEEKFYRAMTDFKFVPGGRVLAGAGTGFDVTFYNCFVLPSPSDSRDGILDNLKAMIEIMARGGGVGINLSSLRPKGARVKKVNGFSSGPCNWAELYSLATHDIIQQGGCFSHDTRIMTHLGLVKIDELVKSKRNYYVSTHKGFRKITTKFDNGKKEVYELETEGGYKVKVTGEHKFLTFDTNGAFYLKPLSEFKVGDYLVLLTTMFNNEIPEAILNTNIPLPSKFSWGRRNVELPKTLNTKLAFILGVYASDGSRIADEYAFSKGLRFAVDAKRKKDLMLLISIMCDVFGIEPIVRRGDGEVMQVEIYSRNIADFLRINNLIKENSNKVFVPEQIFVSSRSVVEAFIAGVFFGDGGNRGGKGGFRITSVNSRFIHDLQLLLLNLGVASKVTKQIRTGWQDLYTLNINGNRYMKQFFEIVRDYTEKASDKKISQRDGFYNFPINVVGRFAYLSGIQRTIAYTNPTTSHKTLAFLSTQFDELRVEDVEDVELATSTIADKIRSITPCGREQVYDLEVEYIHLLSGNGFYTSNSRRGALMLMLWDWHPDIEEFITVKQDLRRINGANLSVCASDEFMEAVKNDRDWDLVFPDLDDKEYDEKWDGILANWKKLGKKVKHYKTVKARYLWDLICNAAWRSAEPGLVFMERYNKWYNNWYWNTVNCVNPCGEEGLPAFGVCNLASLNLASFVKGYSVDKPGTFDYEALADHVRIAVRFQDDVIDADKYIFKEIEKMQKFGERRIGLGTLGLGDALIKMHLKYGSKESLEVIDKIYRTIRDAAYDESANIAKEKGAFPKINIKKHLKGYFIKKIPDSIKKKIKKYGIRNSVLLQAAPTGSTSLLSGTSSGIEPVYEFEFIRRDRLGEHHIYHPLYEEWKKKYASGQKSAFRSQALADKPDYFVSANDLTPEDHVRVQAVVQKYVDASISKTVNAPKNHTVEDVKKLYTLAYELGCKGITYMREGSREGVLSRVESKATSEKKEQNGEIVGKKAVVPRPMQLEGVTYQIETPVGKTYITINQNSNKEPFEVFITIGKSGSDVAAMAEGLARMISLNLRLADGLSPKERVRQVVAQLIGIGGTRSVGFGKDKVRSLPDAVAKILAMHYGFVINGIVEDRKVTSDAKSDFSNDKERNGEGKTQQDQSIVKIQQLAIAGGGTGVFSESGTTLYDICPECGSGSLAYEEGCRKCYSCGYSEC